MGIITKVDLAVAVDFDWKVALESLEVVRPLMRILKVSAKTGEGMAAWLELVPSHRSSAVGLA